MSRPRIAPETRLIALQSEQCAPVVRAFGAGVPGVTPVASLGTIADGLDVPGAIMGHAMLAAVRDSQGSARVLLLLTGSQLIALAREAAHRGARCGGRVFNCDIIGDSILLGWTIEVCPTRLAPEEICSPFVREPC